MLTVTEGRWARGTTLAEALKELKRHGGKGQVYLYVVIGDSQPYVDQFGSICYGGEGKPNAELVTVGPVGTVTALTRRLRELGYS